jgi:hypothetical protein
MRIEIKSATMFFSLKPQGEKKMDPSNRFLHEEGLLKWFGMGGEDLDYNIDRCLASGLVFVDVAD